MGCTYEAQYNCLRSSEYGEILQLVGGIARAAFEAVAGRVGILPAEQSPAGGGPPTLVGVANLAMHPALTAYFLRSIKNQSITRYDIS